MRRAKHDKEDEEDLDTVLLSTIRANIRITLHAGSFLEGHYHTLPPVLLIENR